jgi:hypothetical protein
VGCQFGGTASRVSEQSTLEAKNSGVVRFQAIQAVASKESNLVVMNRTGSLVVQDSKGRDRERYPIVYGARLKVKDGQPVEAGKVLRKYHMPSRAHLMVNDGEQVSAGDVLAKIPRETTKTKDITGGLAPQAGCRLGGPACCAWWNCSRRASRARRR